MSSFYKSMILVALLSVVTSSVAQDKPSEILQLSEVDVLKIKVQLLAQENAELKLKQVQADSTNLVQSLYKQYGVAQEAYDLKLDLGNGQPGFVKKANPKQ